MQFIKDLTTYFKMIKFSHSIFALPFALASFVLASHQSHFSIMSLIWILIAMISARSAAMGFNRFIDHDIDQKNPRTQNRELPQGHISRKTTMSIIIFFSIIFVWSAFQLNNLCFKLSPLCLLILFFYSYTKRFTSFSHWFLGLALAIAPIGAWIAVRGQLSITSIIIALTVWGWVSGFDLIYSCMDIEFDQKNALFSFPSHYGIRIALITARFCHSITFMLFLWLGWHLHLNWFYYLGCAIIGGLFIYEHCLVHPQDMSHLEQAFFTANSYISIVFFIAILIGIL